MPDTTLVDAFSQLGLSEVEATTYLALVRGGPVGATQLSEVVGVPRTTLYSALKSLSDAGLIEGGAGYAGRYRAVPAEHALPSLIQRARDDLHQRELIAKQLATEVAELADRPLDSQDGEVVDVIRSQRGIGDRLARLQLGASEQIRTFIRRPIVVSRTDVVSRETATALERGVHIREIWDLEVVADGRLEERAAAGIEVRVARDTLPHKLAIFDRGIVLLPLETRDDPKPLTALLIRSSAVASSFQTVFDTYWLTAEPPS